MILAITPEMALDQPSVHRFERSVTAFAMTDGYVDGSTQCFPEYVLSGN